jgi:hypothetical protein
MAEARERTAPMVRARAGFHANDAGRQIRKEYRHRSTAQLFAQNRFASFINSMELENVFGQIDSNRCNLHRGRSHSIKW